MATFKCDDGECDENAVLYFPDMDKAWCEMHKPELECMQKGEKINFSDIESELSCFEKLVNEVKILYPENPDEGIFYSASMVSATDSLNRSSNGRSNEEAPNNISEKSMIDVIQELKQDLANAADTRDWTQCLKIREEMHLKLLNYLNEEGEKYWGENKIENNAEKALALVKGTLMLTLENQVRESDVNSSQYQMTNNEVNSEVIDPSSHENNQSQGGRYESNIYFPAFQDSNLIIQKHPDEEEKESPTKPISNPKKLDSAQVLSYMNKSQNAPTSFESLDGNDHRDINNLPSLNTLVKKEICKPRENVHKNTFCLLTEEDDEKMMNLASKTILYKRNNIFQAAKPVIKKIVYFFKNLILVNLPTFAEVNAEYSEKAIRENLHTPDYKDFKITWNLNDLDDLNFFNQINKRFIYLGTVIITKVPLRNDKVNDFLRDFFPSSTRWFSFNKYGENRDSYENYREDLLKALEHTTEKVEIYNYNLSQKQFVELLKHAQDKKIVRFGNCKIELCHDQELEVNLDDSIIEKLSFVNCGSPENGDWNKNSSTFEKIIKSLSKFPNFKAKFPDIEISEHDLQLDKAKAILKDCDLSPDILTKYL
ncbi:unnamed protein product [Moneuplotes crassus]|uniref:Uncharacterized protein n=1 Tax=Euplotes crassus TaxID=5936 RepID=A0AAD1Y5H3_EUPCR|nr:unnamed protein product [Moneuplotes crassus]